jgi:hypothetical protein
MPVILICDACGQKLEGLSLFNSINSRKIKRAVFCDNCMSKVELFLFNEFKLDSNKNEKF